MTKNIVIDGVTYVPEIPTPTGTRAVLVVDRGWIFAGDVTETAEGFRLERAINVRSWDSIGFNGVVADPKSSKVKLDPMPGAVVIPAGSVLFTVPVTDDWGV